MTKLEMLQESNESTLTTSIYLKYIPQEDDGVV